jgi:4-diphosphocytidyl-2-C-methyl-D-erythritol kinase
MNRRVPRRVEVTARAKLNLGLAVGPVRPDGFHDLATIFQSISLADTLRAERTAGGISLAIRHENAALDPGAGAGPGGAVPAGAGNLVVRAAALTLEQLGLPGGVRFSLVKRIPSQSGMGGGSADAAAAIAAVLALHGVRMPRARRIELGARIGSDVPFALVGGTALGRGRGERLDKLRLARPFRAVVVVPRWRISTPAAFRRIDADVKYGLTDWNLTLRFAASLGRKQVTTADTARLGNSFERVLGPRRQDFDRLCARMRTAGLLQPRLTGSGSAVFGIVPRGASIRVIADHLRGNGSVFEVRSTGRSLGIRTQL